MKIKLYLVLFLLISLVISSIACAGSNTVDTPTTTSPTSTTPTTITTPADGSPSVEELRAGNFSHPELPRITAEQLKPMMDEVEGWMEVMEYSWLMPADTNFVLVSVGGSSVAAHIWGTTKFVSNPLYSSGIPMLSHGDLWLLQNLPKDKLIIVYDNGGKDTNAATMVQLLLDLDEGYDLENIKILRKGLGRWKQLGYPFYDPQKGAGT